MSELTASRGDDFFKNDRQSPPPASSAVPCRPGPLPENPAMRFDYPGET
jgi:hypothetical protein